MLFHHIGTFILSVWFDLLFLAYSVFWTVVYWRRSSNAVAEHRLRLRLWNYWNVACVVFWTTYLIVDVCRGGHWKVW